MQEREKERRAICFSLIAGIILLVIGIIMAIKTDSKAMLADALYDSIDIIIVILTLFSSTTSSFSTLYEAVE